jgi:protein-S-isoprenylcysteine O-methyltransferase Ste14
MDERQPEGASFEKDGAAVRIFPPAVPLAVILLGVALERIRPIDLGLSPSAAARYAIGAAIVLGAILGLGLWSVVLFRRSGQSENPWKPTPQIVDRGPFRFSRNPMYVQMLLVCVGVAVMLANVWIALLTPIGAWVLERLAILPEEAYLERKFGDVYRSYRSRVRRWL